MRKQTTQTFLSLVILFICSAALAVQEKNKKSVVICAKDLIIDGNVHYYEGFKRSKEYRDSLRENKSNANENRFLNGETANVEFIRAVTKLFNDYHIMKVQLSDPKSRKHHASIAYTDGTLELNIVPELADEPVWELAVTPKTPDRNTDLKIRDDSLTYRVFSDGILGRKSTQVKIETISDAKIKIIFLTSHYVDRPGVTEEYRVTLAANPDTKAEDLVDEKSLADNAAFRRDFSDYVNDYDFTPLDDKGRVSRHIVLEIMQSFNWLNLLFVDKSTDEPLVLAPVVDYTSHGAARVVKIFHSKTDSASTHWTEFKLKEALKTSIIQIENSSVSGQKIMTVISLEHQETKVIFKVLLTPKKNRPLLTYE